MPQTQPKTKNMTKSCDIGDKKPKSEIKTGRKAVLSKTIYPTKDKN